MPAWCLVKAWGGEGESAPSMHPIPSLSSDPGEVGKLKKIKLSHPAARFLDRN